MRINIIDLQKKVYLNKKKIKEVARRTIKSENPKLKGEINLVFVDDSQIKRLNKYFLKENSPTDVLSFNESISKKTFFGEVIISTQRAKINAKRFKTTLEDEIYLYIIHGILHLLGYTDTTNKQKEQMDKKTQEILLQLKIK